MMNQHDYTWTCKCGHRNPGYMMACQVCPLDRIEGEVIDTTGFWLCLCARVHPPEIEWCTNCYTKRHQGADIGAKVVAGVARDLGLPMGVLEAEGGA